MRFNLVRDPREHAQALMVQGTDSDGVSKLFGIDLSY